MNSYSLVDTLQSIRDVSDFCVQWPKIRDHFFDLKPSSDPTHKEVVEWLAKLADKVCLDEAN